MSSTKSAYYAKTGLLVVSLLLVLLCSACTSAPTLNVPEGFAAYEEDTSITAISPEGVRFQARYEPHTPRQNLEFWQEAVKVHFLQSGYTLQKEESIQTKGGMVEILQWSAPVGKELWSYLTAFAVQGGKIVIIEAAGPQRYFETHREAIVNSIGSLSR